MIRAKGWRITSGSIKIGEYTGFITTSGGAKQTDVRTSSWNGSITHQFDISFSSALEAQTFFDNGGQIRLSADRVGGSLNNQNSSISNMLSEMGTISFGANDTTNSGATGTGSSIGYNNLTTVLQTVFVTNSSASQYTADQYEVQMSKYAGSGNISVLITITDDSDNTFDEAVDGTLTSYVDERRFNTDPTATYTLVDPLEGATAPVASFDDAVAAAAPINYWKFDETVGTTAVDTQGNSNLTLVGTTFDDAVPEWQSLSQPSTRADSIGNAINLDYQSSFDPDAKFDIVGSQLPITSTSTLQNGDWTFMFAGELPSATAWIIDLYDTVDDSPVFSIFYDTFDDTLRIESAADGSENSGVLVSNISGNWSGIEMITIECDTTNNVIKTYSNDFLIGTLSIAGWSSNWRTGYIGPVDGFTLLNQYNGGDIFRGTVDEFLYFNKTIDAGNTLAGDWIELVSWWQFNEDSQGNGPGGGEGE